MTGEPFGLMCAWLAYPYFEETMGETKRKAEARRMRSPED